MLPVDQELYGRSLYCSANSADIVPEFACGGAEREAAGTPSGTGGDRHLHAVIGAPREGRRELEQIQQPLAVKHRTCHVIAGQNLSPIRKRAVDQLRPDRDCACPAPHLVAVGSDSEGYRLARLRSRARQLDHRPCRHDDCEIAIRRIRQLTDADGEPARVGSGDCQLTRSQTKLDTRQGRMVLAGAGGKCGPLDHVLQPVRRQRQGQVTRLGVSFAGDKGEIIRVHAVDSRPDRLIAAPREEAQGWGVGHQIEMHILVREVGHDFGEQPGRHDHGSCLLNGALDPARDRDLQVGRRELESILLSGQEDRTEHRDHRLRRHGPYDVAQALLEFPLRDHDPHRDPPHASSTCGGRLRHPTLFSSTPRASARGRRAWIGYVVSIANRERASTPRQRRGEEHRHLSEPGAWSWTMSCCVAAPARRRGE